MKLETYLAIRALMSADGTMHPRDRSAILAAVRNHGKQPPQEQNQPEIVPPPKVLRRNQVAEMLSCSPRMVDLIAKDGVLPKIRIPGRERAHGFLLADVIELIEQSRQRKAGEDEQTREDASRAQNPIPEDELVILAQKVAYGAATPIEKGKFKGMVSRL